MLPILLLGLAATAAAADQPLVIRASSYCAEFQNGSLTSLVDQSGNVCVSRSKDRSGLGIHRIAGDHWAGAVHGDRQLSDSGQVSRQYHSFSGLKDATAEATYRLDAASGDVVISQRCTSTEAGVWGVSWSIEKIPLDAAIIVPGRSGVRLTADSPGRRHQFDYPIGWEAQLVIVQMPSRGFYVWADDAQGRFKRLVVERDQDGWRLELATMNYAPFEKHTVCESVAWHLNVYQGDWRVPARRYRDWTVANFRPTRIEDQKPDWVKDIRAMVIMGMDRSMLDALPERFDPRQTILYVPSWRSAGYDRDYPVYDEPYEKLKPFVERAHQLGFRVMLHVNYFGVDPLNSAYKEFEPFHVRSPRGEHEKQWWLWTRATPEIRFAYINPACKAWRDHFTSAMVKLCRDYDIDSLHLDQTLCIFNDHNGPIDDMSMIEGNIAIHQQLREALPEVALSGEGLNEVTYRYEAFAQRHAWGLNHADGTYDRRHLERAHPISSYLFRPFAIINGYLGCSPPTEGQLYAAWNEAYEHWGVIPTLKPSLEQLRHPTGFSRQLFDEVNFWQQERLDIDMEGDWADDVAFPLRTANGHGAKRTTDGRLLLGERQISHTITGVDRIEASGSIPGWKAFDRIALLGLDPLRWYPYVEDPRSFDQFHLAALPEGMIAEAVACQDDMAMIRVSSPTSIVADLVELLDAADGGSRPLAGEPFQAKGPFTAPDGSGFDRASETTLSAHPPWKAEGTDPDTGAKHQHGTGVAFVRYRLRLPERGRLQFVSDVFIDRSAVGQPNSDGVTFACIARCDKKELQCVVHNAGDELKKLELDLTPFAGRDVELELSVHPGPQLKPSFDWARWLRPRIERELRTRETIAVAGSKSWRLALGREGVLPVVENGNALQIETELPGTVLLLSDQPREVSLPVDLGDQEWHMMLSADGTHEATAPPFVNVHLASAPAGGVVRSGLSAHPPNQGKLIAHLPIVLPAERAILKTWIGIRDGSESTGVVFAIEVNGNQVAQRRMLPGRWEGIEVDLSSWKGKPIVLSFTTDSDGSYSFDWACWGEPRLEPQ